MAKEPKKVDDPYEIEDPWAKLSPEEKKKAERHLLILYISMGLMVIAPFIVFFILKN